AGMLLVISFLRNRDSFRPFSLATNYGLIVLGGFLFLMQMNDYFQNPQDEIATTKPSIIREVRAVAPSTTDWQDSFRITIPAGGDKEFKLRLEQGQSLEYSWSTDGSGLFFDMHGEPEGDTTGAFTSYQVSVAPKADGTIDAPFTGTHGWYWKNESKTPVTITLNVRGDYQPITK
ncbi:MAG: hypothetical protein HQL53_10000, partial [Magnetococcales bacterium]|nr:hypothetical protein [Magnetococcales bacterium]